MTAPRQYQQTSAARSRLSGGLLVLALLAVAVPGCSITDATGTSSERLELARNRQRWASAAIHDYEYDFRLLCFCPQESTEEVHIVVKQDAIVSIVRTRDGLPAGTKYGGWPRVDDLFADVQARLDQRIGRLVVEYDPTYGYPRSIVADVALMAVDDEYSMTAANLRRLP